MSVHDLVNNVRSKNDLVRFIETLVNEYRANPNEWENNSLESYLDALASWLADSDAYYLNKGLAIPTNPSWKNFADMLIAASMYE